MAYSGWFLKIGDYTFPMRLIKQGTYDSAPAQRQSLDAYTDENGVTHDNALEHSKTEIKFTTLAMGESEWTALMRNIVRNYISFNARDMYCTYYDFERCDYRTGHFYMDKNFRANANDVGGNLKYNETSWLFIEY